MRSESNDSLARKYESLSTEELLDILVNEDGLSDEEMCTITDIIRERRQKPQQSSSISPEPNAACDQQSSESPEHPAKPVEPPNNSSLKSYRKTQRNNSTTDRLFGTMITPSIISIIWVIGAVFMTLVGLLSAQEQTIWFAFLGIVLGNIVWRVVCEYIIIIFEIHSSLRSIELKVHSK